MKIGLVCPYDMFKGGGVQECVLALQHELMARGHIAKIITPRPKGSSEKSTETMLLVGNSRDITAFHTTAQVAVAMDTKELDAILDHEQFDVIHFHEPWVPVIGQQILKRSQAAHVATFHAHLPNDTFSRTIQKTGAPYAKSILKRLDVIVAVSDAAAEYVRTVDARDPRIVPNAIDLGKYTWVDHVEVSDAPTIVYIGRLEKRKGVAYLIDAFAQLQKDLPAAQLVIGGDGVDRQKLEQYVAENAVEHVSFKGFLSEQEKLDLLARADLFCSPALYGESFGIVLIEAMARGAVVLAGDNPGYRGVMRDMADSSLVDPKDTEVFAQKLYRLLTDMPLRKRWLAWSKDYHQQFDYRKIVDQYEAIYKEAIAHKNRQKKAKNSA